MITKKTMKITSITPVDNNGAFAKKAIVTCEGYDGEIQVFYSEDLPYKVGDMFEVTSLNPFTEITNNGTFDQRKKGHRSPFY